MDCTDLYKYKIFCTTAKFVCRGTRILSILERCLLQRISNYNVGSNDTVRPLKLVPFDSYLLERKKRDHFQMCYNAKLGSCACVCVCVCDRERERGREGENLGETEWEKEREQE